MISIDELRSRYSYDPETGQISNRKNGYVLTSKSRNRNTEYLRVNVAGMNIRAHRVAWAIHYGEWPKGQIDHRDGNGLNNRLSNLRDTTNSENQRNQRVRGDSESGVKGVCPCRKSGKWQALIWVNGKRMHLGRFATIELAAAARLAAEEEYWQS